MADQNNVVEIENNNVQDNVVAEMAEERKPDFWDGVADFGRKATKWVLIGGGIALLAVVGLAVANGNKKKDDDKKDDNDSTDFWNNIPDIEEDNSNNNTDDVEA